jgi:hypothetical protein
MGYSIGMRPKSKQLKDKMLAFMEKYYRPYSVAFKKITGAKADYSRFTDDMSYDNGHYALGFDFNACDPERDYIFAVTRWMALKIGKERLFKGVGSVPFYVYDGGITPDDRWPILVESVWKDKAPAKYQWTLTDDLGYKSLERQWLGVPYFTNEDGSFRQDKLKERVGFLTTLYGTSPYKCWNHIRKELQRLDKLWEKFQ